MPQYDYLLGGIPWETLPIDIQDINRIEIIKTPSVVFFGGMAINGVIHIFTHTPQNNDLTFTLNSQAGIAPSAGRVPLANNNLSGTHRGDLSFGVSDKLRFRLSGNYHFMHRSQDEYYLLTQNRYIPSDSLLFFKQNAPQTNLKTTLARENLGVNAFTFYKPTEKISTSAQLFFQQSEAQTIYTDDTLALAHRTSNTYGINLNTHAYNFHLNISHHRGRRDYALGYVGNDFNFSQTQASLNHHFLYKGVNLQSGAGFLQSEATAIAPLNISQPQFVNYFAFFKTNFHILPKWRVMASIRGDKYERLNPLYLSYQLSSSIKLNQHVVRAAYTYNEGAALVRQFHQQTARAVLPNINPNKTQSFEVGWSSKIIANLNASLTAFYSHLDFNTIYQPSTSSTDGQNYQSTLAQIGSTARVQAWLNKFQLEGFITLQRSAQNLSELQSNYLQSTPQFYGGFQLHYAGLLNKLNVNIQGYFYEGYQLNTQYEQVYIPTRMLLNGKISYRVWQKHSIFVNVRNLLNTAQQEYAFADAIAGLYLIGININL
jgi:iron complex outermembrane receptor protein